MLCPDEWGGGGLTCAKLCRNNSGHPDSFGGLNCAKLHGAKQNN